MTFREAKEKFINELHKESNKYLESIKKDFKEAEPLDPLAFRVAIELSCTQSKYDFLKALLDTIAKLDMLDTPSYEKNWREEDDKGKLSNQIYFRSVILAPDKKWQDKVICTYDEMNKLGDYILNDKKDDFYIHLSKITKNKRMSERHTRYIFGTAPKHKT